MGANTMSEQEMGREMRQMKYRGPGLNCYRLLGPHLYPKRKDTAAEINKQAR